ncbi:RT0821/Lpp0805 family surface protein [Ancylobacter sp. 6x-1]|uniref:RT0821/Lpp0805 family surface protein n=1 Tax=Ancylobacter crimeensis TaxID=2579147 RepID=A0ABT0DAW2_9HYPH|nr:RT0821/Lpp0805 family surface protein [Ancylobacter crimeensis]MCK0197103.1 RT0821/Lpp0805 family surface protein [Ancylobacter crimeensis]
MRRTASIAVLLVAGSLCGGCASIFSDDSIVTGSVPVGAMVKPVAYRPGDLPSGVAADDWVLAREALSEALSTGADAPSVPWENPASRRRGNATLVGSAEQRDGMNCRTFLVSIVASDDGAGDAGRWVQGQACRATRTASWKIDQARLLQKT